MSLEDAKYIKELNEANPDELDSFSQADNHIFLMKDVLKKTFPLFTTPVNMSSKELDNLSSVFGSSTTHFEIGSATPAPDGFPVKFLGYVDAGTNENKYATFDKDTKMIYKQDGLGVLGSIFWSILDNTKMQTLYPGNIFALCDGITSTVGSQMDTLFGLKVTPSFPGEALIMEVNGAGEAKTILEHRPYNTDTSRFGGNTGVQPWQHNHAGPDAFGNVSDHKHSWNIHSERFATGSTPGKYLSMSSTGNPNFNTVIPTPELPQDIPIDKHRHTINHINVHTETSPPAIYLNAYMRIN